MKKFKIRPSQAGKLMSGKIGLSDKQEGDLAKYTQRKIDAENGIDKVKPLTDNMERDRAEWQYTKDNPELPKGAKTYLQTWFKEQIYSRSSFFQSKFTAKGNIQEDNSIDFLAEQLGYSMLIKNDETLSGEYIEGTPDIVIPDCVIDVKNSWDCFTFPLLNDDIPNDDYWWQGQCYMKLTGKKHFKLVYVLSDTPEHLIRSEATRYCRLNGYEWNDENIYQEFFERMTYSNIKDAHKIKVYEFGYDEKAINELIIRVKMARDFIESLSKQFNDGKEDKKKRI